HHAFIRDEPDAAIYRQGPKAGIVRLPRLPDGLDLRTSTRRWCDPDDRRRRRAEATARALLQEGRRRVRRVERVDRAEREPPRPDADADPAPRRFDLLG